MENPKSAHLKQPVSAKAWCSPVWTQGDVEQNEQHCSYYGCQQRPHPGAKLAEVTVLHNGDQNGTAHEHGILQQRERAGVSFFVLPFCTELPVHIKERVTEIEGANFICDMHSKRSLTVSAAGDSTWRWRSSLQRARTLLAQVLCHWFP